MFRNNYLNAIVLKTYQVGEMHKGVMLLTPDNGIISAIAHGAKKIKNRFRSSTEQFCISRFYLYYNPIKKDYKITDIEPHKAFNGIRISLSKYYTASLWVEIILRSFAGGENNASVYNLLCEALDILNLLPEEKIPYITIQFIWRFICLSGYNPSLDVCGSCGKIPDSIEPMYLESNTFLCASCSRETGFKQSTSSRLPTSSRLSPGSRMYMINTMPKRLNEAVKITLEQESVIGLKSILYDLIQRILETELNSIKCSEGYI